ncbi:hypothetical protein [Streptomyces sp. NPDC057428]
MIELTVDAAGLARSRFAVSPLHEVVATLLPCTHSEGMRLIGDGW